MSSTGKRFLQGIELHRAASNILLGQFHMEKSGQFVAARPGRLKSHLLPQQAKSHSHQHNSTGISNALNAVCDLESAVTTGEAAKLSC